MGSQSPMTNQSRPRIGLEILLTLGHLQVCIESQFPPPQPHIRNPLDLPVQRSRSRQTRDKFGKAGKQARILSPKDPGTERDR